MDLATIVDRLLPGPGSCLDHASQAAQSSVSHAFESGPLAPARAALHGNEWLGHPLHPLVVAVPIGAWVVTGWYDVRAALSGAAHHDRAADAALEVGLLGAVAAAATGLAQFPDTQDAARRETTVHAALNNVGLGLCVGSWLARRAGRRPLGVALSGAALGVVALSGFLGGDLVYRHGIGVASDTQEAPPSATAVPR